MVRIEKPSIHITNNRRCTLPYHLSIEKYTNIKDHLDEEFSGLLGTGHNDWSHAVPAPLGRLIKVIGAGVGSAHAEVEDMAVGIF